MPMTNPAALKGDSHDMTARTALKDQRFFMTRPHDCSYLADREATTLFLDPQTPIESELYSTLTLMGFRRSGQHLYRPHCRHCRACISVRVPVADFMPGRSLVRTARRNRDLVATECPAVFHAEHYALYERYIQKRHYDGDMYPPSIEQYQAFLTGGGPHARLVEFRRGEALLAVAAVDVLEHGLSAIYTFFDPDPAHDARSPGSYAVLWQIERARQLGLPHVYLGYWIAKSRKMAYKTRFKPLEYFYQNRWQRTPPSTASDHDPDHNAF